MLTANRKMKPKRWTVQALALQVLDVMKYGKFSNIILADCSMVSVRMTQTANAAKWKLSTSMLRPRYGGVISLAMVNSFIISTAGALVVVTV